MCSGRKEGRGAGDLQPGQRRGATLWEPRGHAVRQRTGRSQGRAVGSRRHIWGQREWGMGLMRCEWGREGTAGPCHWVCAGAGAPCVHPRAEGGEQSLPPPHPHARLHWGWLFGNHTPEQPHQARHRGIGLGNSETTPRPAALASGGWALRRGRGCWGHIASLPKLDLTPPHWPLAREHEGGTPSLW